MPNNVAGLQLQGVAPSSLGLRRTSSHTGNAWQYEPETPSRRLNFGLGIGTEHIVEPQPPSAPPDQVAFSGLGFSPAYEGNQACFAAPAPRRPSWDAFGPPWAGPTTPPLSPVPQSPFNDLAGPWPAKVFAGVQRRGYEASPEVACVSPQLVFAPDRNVWLPQLGTWTWSQPWADGAISYQPLRNVADLLAAASEINGLNCASQASVVRNCVLQLSHPLSLQAQLREKGYRQLLLEDDWDIAAPVRGRPNDAVTRPIAPPPRDVTPEPSALRQQTVANGQLETPTSLRGASPVRSALRTRAGDSETPVAGRKRVRLALKPSYAPSPVASAAEAQRSPTASASPDRSPTPPPLDPASPPVFTPQPPPWTRREPLLRITWYREPNGWIFATLPAPGVGRDAILRATLELWCAKQVEIRKDRGEDGRLQLRLFGLAPLNGWLREAGLQTVVPVDLVGRRSRA